MARLPTSSAEITPAWLTERLRSTGTIDASTSVSSIEGDTVGPGIGFMGEVGRIKVGYSGGSGPTTMICKIPTQDANVRGLLAAARVFEREARFYADIAPSLDVVPQAYGIASDFENDDHVLVLEDLSHLRVGDQAAGVSEKDGHAAMRAAARLHARYWQNDALAAIDWMPMANSDGMKIGREVYAASLPDFFKSSSTPSTPTWCLSWSDSGTTSINFSTASPPCRTLWPISTTDWTICSSTTAQTPCG